MTNHGRRSDSLVALVLYSRSLNDKSNTYNVTAVNHLLGVVVFDTLMTDHPVKYEMTYALWVLN